MTHNAAPSTNSTIKVLIAAPVHQDSVRLKKYLESLFNLDTDELVVGYLFIDDNTDLQSKLELYTFSQLKERVNIIVSHNSQIRGNDSFTHQWSSSLIQKMVHFRNFILNYAKINEYDYLFMIDSDIMIHKNTLLHLIAQKKDVISEVFWTKWTPQTIELPQVWMSDKYTLYDYDWGGALPDQETVNRLTMDFLHKLKIPGVYPVGGLGACTLISKAVLQSAISYDKIPNVSFWGEDRHFCIRAAVLGFGLFADTFYPAFHIYRTEYLPEAEKYAIENNYQSIGWDEYAEIEPLTEHSFVSSVILSLLKQLQKNSNEELMQVLAENLRRVSVAERELMEKINDERLDSFTAYSHLGLAYYYLGQLPISLHWFRFAQMIHPEDRDIINNINIVLNEIDKENHIDKENVFESDN